MLQLQNSPGAPAPDEFSWSPPLPNAPAPPGLHLDDAAASLPLQLRVTQLETIVRRWEEARRVDMERNARLEARVESLELARKVDMELGQLLRGTDDGKTSKSE